MVLSSQLCMFKCQKQVETAAYSNHILSITLETTVYLNDSDKTKPITALKHFVSTQTSIKGLRKEWAEPVYLYLQLKCIKDDKVIRKLLINNNTRTPNKEDKALRTFVLQVGERIWKTYAGSGSFHLLTLHCPCDDTLPVGRRCRQGPGSDLVCFQWAVRGSSVRHLVPPGFSDQSYSANNTFVSYLGGGFRVEIPEALAIFLIFRVDCINISFLCHKNSNARGLQVILSVQEKKNVSLFP